MLKPYLNSSIHIKSLYTYRDFLKKRPKMAHQFKITMMKTPLRMNQNDEKKVQFQLIRASKLLKSAPKVDIRDCIIEDYGFWKAKLLSVYKRISRTKTLFVVNPRNESEMKDFKYFPQLKHLVYQLGGYCFASQDYNLPNPEPEKAHKYLKYLRYSPKMNSFSLADFSTWHFPKMGMKGRSCLKSLQHLSLKREKLIQNEFGFPIEHCKNLKSICFNFDDICCPKPLIQMLDELPNCPYLQEICMNFNKISKFDFLTPFKKLTQKGILKKVKFEFGKGMLNLGKILDSLTACKLMSFSLKAFIKEGFLESIAQFLESMGTLESFELHVLNPDLFSDDDDLMEVCKQISKLQALRNLKLHLETSATCWRSAKISNFIPYLLDVFTKQIKIETLHIGCSQLDSSEAIQSLISVLENSAASLTHLTIDLRDLPANKKIYRAILKFLRKLSSIQVLAIPCLGFSGSTSQFFNELAGLVHESKYLRVLEIGKIKGEIHTAAFSQTVETIVSQRGLRKFEFSLSRWGRNLPNKPNMKRIIEKNPYLETLEITNCFFFDLGLDIEDWTGKIYER